MLPTGRAKILYQGIEQKCLLYTKFYEKLLKITDLEKKLKFKAPSGGGNLNHD